MQQLFTRSGAPASRFSFGTMQFGGKADAKASAEMFEDCRNAGINFFDTAYVYTDGASETIYGELAGNDPDALLTATKVAYDRPATAQNITATFDISRKRLGMDAVDLLYLHRFDPVTPLEESFECLAKMQERGVIRYIGISNFAAWQIVKANQVAKSFGTRIDVVQPMYSLVKRQVEVEILPACKDQGIAVCSYSPLGAGLLTGKYDDQAQNTGRLAEDKRYRARYGADWMHDCAHAFSKFAWDHKIDPATLAVAWVAANPYLYGPIISASSSTQLKASLDAIDFQMPQDLYQQISDLSQSPPPATDRLEEA